MRRPALLLVMICVLATAGTAILDAVPAGAAAAGVAPRASLTPIACRSTLAPAQRRVSVVSVMRHRPGTRTLSVRVTLLEKLPGAVARAVVGGDLGSWLTPAVPSLGRNPADVWRLDKAVYGVDAPASYRFVVDFRWLGAGGRVLARRTLSTAACAIRQLAPDVLVRSVSVTPLAGRPGPLAGDRYVATIANRGATASGPFSVSLEPGPGLAAQTRPVASLGPGAHERVTFVGPVCSAAEPPTIVADPDDRVDDFDRANNTRMVICPSS